MISFARADRTHGRTLSLLVVTVLAASLAVALPAAQAAPPPNDDIADATVIHDLQFRERFDLHGATRAESDPKCAGGSPRTVWYAFTPPRTMSLEARIPGSLGLHGPDFTLSAYSGRPGSLDQLACTTTSRVADGFGARIGIPRAPEGQTVFFMVGGRGGAAKLRVLRARPAPENDDLKEATVIDSLPFRDEVDNFWATAEGDPANAPGCPRLEHSSWYSYTAPTATHVQFDTPSDPHDDSLAYVGSPSNLTQVDCTAEAFESTGVVTEVNLRAGQTAYFAAGARDRVAVKLRKRPISSSSHDELASPRSIGRRFSETVETTGATSDPGDPDCHGAGGTVWYRFVPPFTMRAEARTAASSYDTVLGAYEATDRGLREIACRNDELAPNPADSEQGYGAPAERVRFKAVEGHVYRFMVGALEEPSLLQFRLREFVPVHIDPEGSVLPGGGAEIRGTVRCTHRLEGFGSIGAAQRLDSGRIIEGFGGFDRGCREGVSRFRVELLPDGGEFRSGRISVDLSWAFFSDQPGFRTRTQTDVSTAVHLG